MDAIALSRRSLLKSGGGIALSFCLPWSAFGQGASDSLPGSLKATPSLDAWFRIGADGTITLLTGKVELGQGVLTALTQIAADELDVPIGRLTVISGDTGVTPKELSTVGSLSMTLTGTAVRQAAAEVRQILVDLASTQLKVDAARLRVEDAVVVAPDGRRASYAELLGGRAIARKATGHAKPKPAEHRRYIGRSTPRIDLPAKVSGAPIFVQDYRPAGMLHARVLRRPSQGAELLSFDEQAVTAMPGVVKVIRDGSFLAVIAEREDQAIAAVEALEQSAKWREFASDLTEVTVYDWLRAQPSKEIPILAKSTPGETPTKELKAVYRRPFQMHGSIGPSAAVGLLQDGQYLIQTHSQSVFDTAGAIAEMLRVPAEQVRLQHMQGSGCYGHNGADDAAADAALLARAIPGRPVRVQWRRKDEHMCEPYGSAMEIEVRAGVDVKGDVIEWKYDLWSTPHSTRPDEAGNLLPARSLAKPFVAPAPFILPAPSYGPDRNALPIYDFPTQSVTTHWIEAMPVRVSSLRSLGAYANIFAIESFMDELAMNSGADPLEYRLRFLKDPRAAETLNRAATAFGWSQPRPHGRGRGMAFARYKNLAAYCAVIIEVEVSQATGEVRVHRVVSSVDTGEIINPEGVKSQIEGGIIQSLSWSLKEEVRFRDGRTLDESWADYPILTFAEIPAIHVELLDRPGAPFLGVGEASQGPTPAALANAIFDASDIRLRTLPFTPQRVSFALREKASGK
ncbi:xanthine dehydrogenase family protein molybdopterin-binding subunit [Rhizobium aegyptiacum]|uniref:xanthine dehydrogenase family protein molybdopterin-binding subunit n=1 Tax=Rhizobium aegyptiacum TaxID=1764550 RepID=UPI0007E5794B|nr:molybdopterin cofactor-binding domain-containing protein [Rhizobium aegyptiacum]